MSREQSLTFSELLGGSPYLPRVPVVKFIKMHEKAEKPEEKTHKDDVGYNLVAIKEHKRLTSRTVMYDTGLIVRPPPGYYTEIIPRSSMGKSGHILANSVGIVDPGYTGTLLIALTKIDDGAPDLKLPFSLCQLVLRKFEDYTLEETTTLEETSRGSGGFGSTDKK